MENIRNGGRNDDKREKKINELGSVENNFSSAPPTFEWKNSIL